MLLTRFRGKPLIMKIAVNARFLIPGKLEGFGVFTYEVLKRWIEDHPQHHFILIYDRQTPSWFPHSSNVTEKVLYPSARHPLLWWIWFEFSLPRLLKKLQPDVFVSMDGYLPLKTDIPKLPVIHDLAFEHFPEDVPRTTSLYYRYFFPRFAQEASRIATVSEYSKQDIVSRYHIDPKKIDVVYNGANADFEPISADRQQQQREELIGGSPYFIYVGALHSRKNIARLLRAFDRFREEDQHNHKLVLVGRKAWKRTEMERAYEAMKHRQDVIFTGMVERDRLKEYLASAKALCYVSYFEGFGIPLLEAFHAEVPVITANVSSLPEVGGDAALYVDPFDIESIAQQLKRMANDPQLRQTLIENAKTQRTHFSWQKTADRLWEAVLGT